MTIRPFNFRVVQVQTSDVVLTSDQSCAHKINLQTSDERQQPRTPPPPPPFIREHLRRRRSWHRGCEDLQVKNEPERMKPGETTLE